MRTIIDLPEQQLKGLQQLADAQHASRAEIVRQAVAEYLTRAEQRSQPHSAWEAAYGLWARNPKEPGEDGLKYQLRMRDEWSGRDEVIEEVIETRVQLAAQKKAGYAATPSSPKRASKKNDPMNTALFDSNILIDYLNRHAETRTELARYRSHAISVITWIEVMAGCRSGEESMLRTFLDLFEVKTITPEIAERTAEIRRERRIKMPDAIIAATAEVHGLLLVTRNSKDFDGGSPGVRIPYQLKT